MKHWLDENLWLTIGIFSCMYLLAWICYFITLGVEVIFAKKTNGVEMVTNRLYVFFTNIAKYTLYVGAAMIVIALLIEWL